MDSFTSLASSWLLYETESMINIGEFKNDVATIPRIVLSLSEGEDVPLQRTQFSIQSCFSLTTQKV